jgi:hypothetical protein
LWVAKVHHFIEKFVDDNEVVAYRFFFEFFGIFGEDFDNFVEEEEDLGGVRVAFCEC